MACPYTHLCVSPPEGHVYWPATEPTTCPHYNLCVSPPEGHVYWPATEPTTCPHYNLCVSPPEGHVYWPATEPTTCPHYNLCVSPPEGHVYWPATEPTTCPHYNLCVSPPEGHAYWPATEPTTCPHYNLCMLPPEGHGYTDPLGRPAARTTRVTARGLLTYLNREGALQSTTSRAAFDLFTRGSFCGDGGELYNAHGNSIQRNYPPYSRLRVIVNVFNSITLLTWHITMYNHDIYNQPGLVQTQHLSEDIYDSSGLIYWSINSLIICSRV